MHVIKGLKIEGLISVIKHLLGHGRAPWIAIKISPTEHPFKRIK